MVGHATRFWTVSRGLGAAACLALIVAIVGAQSAYVTPRSGWLYVVDSNKYGDEGRLHIVNPDEGRIVWSRMTGHLPDIALSPDGSRLYLASSVLEGDLLRGHLEIIDTATGLTVQDLPNPDRAVSTLPSYMSRMAMSPDGRWLFQFKMNNAPGNATYYVDTFDTERGAFLARNTPTPLCAWPTLLPSSESGRLTILCNETSDARFLTPTEPTQGGQRLALASLGPAVAAAPGSVRDRSRPPATAIVGPRAVTVIMGDGRFVKTDAQSHQVMQTDLLDRTGRGIVPAPQGDQGAAAAKTPQVSRAPDTNDWLAGRWIKQQAPLLSPNGQELYFGVSSLFALQQGRQPLEQVIVLDAQTLARRRSINVRQVFDSLALSKDGTKLYAVHGDTATVRVIDTASGRELSAFNAGVTPVFAVVAP
jgi:hypothetical protein